VSQNNTFSGGEGVIMGISCWINIKGSKEPDEEIGVGVTVGVIVEVGVMVMVGVIVIVAVIKPGRGREDEKVFVGVGESVGNIPGIWVIWTDRMGELFGGTSVLIGVLGGEPNVTARGFVPAYTGRNNRVSKLVARNMLKKRFFNKFFLISMSQLYNNWLNCDECSARKFMGG
jgi:hypothetical protein